MLQAAADVKVLDRHGALKFIQSSKGCLLRDLTAAYPAAPDDLAQLKSEGLVWILPSAEKEQEAVFAAESPPLINLSTDTVKLWHRIEVCILCDPAIDSKIPCLLWVTPLPASSLINAYPEDPQPLEVQYTALQATSTLSGSSTQRIQMIWSSIHS